MSDMPWPAAGTRLESRYRRLLLAYPRRYRRTEMLTTLLEMAEPGQTRPTGALRLVATGLRQRFRLPAGRRLAWVATILTTLILGGFGAAAGSAVAALTFADLPSDAAFATMVGRLAAAAPDGDVSRQRSPWSLTFLAASAESAGWDAASARQALLADGWEVTPVQVRSDPATYTLTRFDATRDGLRLAANGYRTDRHDVVSITAAPIVTGSLLPLIALGTLGGLLTGWTLATAAAYRFRSRPPARSRAAAVTAGLTLTALLPPALAFAGNLLRILLYHPQPWPSATVHSALTPGPYYPFGPPWLNLALTAAGAALALTTAAVLLPTTAPTPDEVPATG